VADGFVRVTPLRNNFDRCSDVSLHQQLERCVPFDCGVL
jgi:hypothetical protein